MGVIPAPLQSFEPQHAALLELSGFCRRQWLPAIRFRPFNPGGGHLPIQGTVGSKAFTIVLVRALGGKNGENGIKETGCGWKTVIEATICRKYLAKVAAVEHGLAGAKDQEVHLVMKQAKVLFIAHRIPYPPNKGDKIRTYHMLRYLAQRYRVAVACMIDDPEDLIHLEPLKQMAERVFHVLRTPLVMKCKAIEAVLSGEPFTKPCFYSKELQKAIDDYLENNEVQAVICFCSSSAEYVFKSRHFKSLLKKILLADLIDVDSEKWRQYAEQKTGLMRWLYRREANCLRPVERQIINVFDQTFLVSEEEKGVLAEFADVDKVEALSNGVDLDYFSPESHGGRSVAQDTCRLVFSGAMDYWPNIEGAVWFAENVFPTIKKTCPDTVFCIAGRNPDERVMELRKQKGIEVTGTVPDIRDYLSSAALCVVPSLLGTRLVVEHALQE